jgi:DNA-binding NarL/FixJ family response regulator
MPDVSPSKLCYTSITRALGRYSAKGRLFVSRDRPTRILVVDNDARIRSALQTLLRQEPEQLAIQETANLDGLGHQVRDFQPDLVLLDWELPGRPAAALLLALHGLTHHPRVIVLSARPESEADAMAAGADAFVSKSDPPERLLDSFRHLVREARDEASA